MPGRPRLNAATNAPGAISPARLVLTSSAVGLHARQVFGRDDAARRVDETHVQARTSQLGEEVCLAVAMSSPRRARARGASRAQTSTLMPKARP